MTHRHEVRIYWEDTDAGGIVYHANYLKFAERARSEAVREAGINQSELAADGFAFTVRHMDMDFLASAKLDDRLVVESGVTEVGGASFEVQQVIRRLDDGPELVRLKVRLAFVALAEGRAARMPQAVRAILQGLVKERR
jgi:acyl-CoA thioester hydrolase